MFAHPIAHETNKAQKKLFNVQTEHRRRYSLSYSIGVPPVPTTNQLAAADY